MRFITFWDTPLGVLLGLVLTLATPVVIITILEKLEQFIRRWWSDLQERIEQANVVRRRFRSPEMTTRRYFARWLARKVDPTFPVL